MLYQLSYFGLLFQKSSFNTPDLPDNNRDALPTELLRLIISKIVFQYPPTFPITIGMLCQLSYFGLLFQKSSFNTPRPSR